MFFSVMGVVASSIETWRPKSATCSAPRCARPRSSSTRAEGLLGDAAQAQPVLSENLTGLARTIRAAVNPALENVTLWHERDISHSSVERVFAPTPRSRSTSRSPFERGDREPAGLSRAHAGQPRPLGGLVYSQRVLLALTQAGISREDAYRLVQQNAMQLWREGGDFRSLLKADPEVAGKVDAETLDDCFDPGHHTKHVGNIFARVFPG